MKAIGLNYLICALLCVVMTVTTTVIHMNRLQTYDDCNTIPSEKSCICVPKGIANGVSSIEGLISL